MTRRQECLSNLDHDPLVDMVVIGGGINGAWVFNECCRRGYRTLLVDQRDFSSGTSQASGMLLWGGLLYLKQLDFLAVRELSLERERLIRQSSQTAVISQVRYIPWKTNPASAALTSAGLLLYWLLGQRKRARPSIQAHYPESELLLDPSRISFLEEEAVLRESDSRYTVDLICARREDHALAVNYLRLEGQRRESSGRWSLSFTDSKTKKRHQASCAAIVNCAGPSCDSVNAFFGIRSPFRHFLSKGVYLGLRRIAGHSSYTVLDQPDGRDVLTLVPWGPLSLWGPTETFFDGSPEELTPQPEDIGWLADQYQKQFKRGIDESDFVSIRVGLRPLVADATDPRPKYPLDLSRRQEVFRDPGSPFLCCYGGKLTNGRSMAEKALRLLQDIPPSFGASEPQPLLSPMEDLSLDGATIRIVKPEHARDHEFCCSSEDYLRRRTNVAQWIPRGGLGRDRANEGSLAALVQRAVPNELLTDNNSFHAYAKKASSDFDRFLSALPSEGSYERQI